MCVYVCEREKEIGVKLYKILSRGGLCEQGEIIAFCWDAMPTSIRRFQLHSESLCRFLRFQEVKFESCILELFTGFAVFDRERRFQWRMIKIPLLIWLCFLLYVQKIFAFGLAVN